MPRLREDESDEPSPRALSNPYEVPTQSCERALLVAMFLAAFDSLFDDPRGVKVSSPTPNRVGLRLIERQNYLTARLWLVRDMSSGVDGIAAALGIPQDKIVMRAKDIVAMRESLIKRKTKDIRASGDYHDGKIMPIHIGDELRKWNKEQTGFIAGSSMF